MDSFNNTSDLRVTSGMETNWRITSKWAMFFAVLGFIFAGFYLLGAIAIIPMIRMMASMGVMPEPMASLIGSFSWVFVLIYLIALGSLFFLSYFLLKFSNGINRAINFTDQNAFVGAWRNLRNHYRLNGSMVIVFIVLYIVMVIAVFSIVGSAGGNLNY